MERAKFIVKAWRSSSLRYTLCFLALGFVLLTSPPHSFAANGVFTCAAKQVFAIEADGTLKPVENYFLKRWSGVRIDTRTGQVSIPQEQPTTWTIMQPYSVGNDFVAASTPRRDFYPSEMLYVRDWNASNGATFRVYMISFIITGSCRQ